MTDTPKPKPTPKRRPPQNRPKKKPPLPAYRKGPLSWVIVLLVLFIGMMIFNQSRATDTLRWDQFVDLVENKHIESVTYKETTISGKYNQSYIQTYKDEHDGAAPKPSFAVDYKPEIDRIWLTELGKQMDADGVEQSREAPRIWLYMLMQYLLPLILFVGLFYFLFMRNMRGGAGGMLMSFGRSRHRIHSKDDAKMTFNDVAGIEEAKDELAEIIEFLRTPKKFQRLGGRIPRGVLLVGPPGCGKTLLAKAVAGEADVPFFSISGSDFVEMFVGVGASRVRDLFKQAKDNSPCIIFLDEVDAIGRKRGPGFVGGGNDEREQTLNAILVEMDGFETNDQVIVIAATNRADILDHALTRPGRFDRQIFVPLPDIKGRVDILKVHAKKVKLGPDSNLERLARGTPMFSGADLAAIINEAALAATMADKEHVEMEDLEEARDKVRWGRAKKSRVIDKQEKEITAYHEAGHTLVQSLLEEADPLHKVSIIPRGPMGGATFALPEKDRTIFTKKYCMALLQVCFGGRIAEEIFFEDISSGAQSDISQSTKIAKQMVLTWGMSTELGPISYGPESGLTEAIYAMPGGKEYSENTAETIDREVRKITGEAYDKAKELIQANKDNVQKIARALLKYETLDAEDVQLLLDGGELDKPTVAGLLEAEQAKNSKAKPQEAGDSEEKPEEAGDSEEKPEETGDSEEKPEETGDSEEKPEEPKPARTGRRKKSTQ